MARKKKHPEHINHERWLVSYADFITLLFAFFVVMFAVSQVDTKKVGRFTEAFSKATGVDMFPDKGTGFMPTNEQLVEKEKDETKTTPPGQLPHELEEARKAIELKMKTDSALNGMQVLSRRNELVLRLADSIFFDVGKDELKAPATDLLKSLAPELVKRSLDVRVEGHTDSRPISTARFRSNWDLSTARATVVILKLATDGMPPARLSAAGYGEFRPIAPNETDDGRKQNRRVDLVVSVSEPLASVTPPTAETDAGVTASAPLIPEFPLATDAGATEATEAALPDPANDAGSDAGDDAGRDAGLASEHAHAATHHGAHAHRTHAHEKEVEP